MRTKILLLLAASAATAALRAQTIDPTEPMKKPDDVVILEKFVADEKAFDPTGVMPNKPVNSAFGFDKSLVETPRAITIVSQQQLDLVGIRNAEDVVKVAPGTYSNFRFGLQGNISIRNQTSDFYFRGMKRIDPQGNFRTVWSSNDSLEIIRGPASPIFGLGRIGGYVNFVPKTARASAGKYLDHETGSVKITYGGFDKKIVTGDVSGPAPLFGKEGGYSIYGYFEDSGGFKVNGFHKDSIVQATYSMNLTKELRVETGTVLQHSYGGLPGGINRTTRDMISTHTYWRGGFSYMMDLNGDGKISEREVRRSYFGGTGGPLGDGSQLSVLLTSPIPAGFIKTQIGPSTVYNGQVNDPLFRRIPWQGGVVDLMASNPNPKTITLAQFNAGYIDPVTRQQRKGYQLLFYPTKGDGNTVNKGAPGQIPDFTQAAQKFYLPYAFDLDPTTWQQVALNPRMSLGEDYYSANIGAFFFDIVNDYNPDQTYKNQLFLDTHKQVKDGRNPFSQWQQPTTLEDKITFTKKFKPKAWWDLNLLASANVWHVWTYRNSTSPTDIDFRRDLQRDTKINNTFTPNDTFYSIVERRDYDGSPPSFYLRSEFTISGAGVLLDQTFFEKLNLLGGFRYDYVDAWTRQPKGTYDKGGSGGPGTLWVGGPAYPFAGTGLFTDRNFDARGNSSAPSISASLSYAAPFGLRPYLTLGQQAVLINNASAQELSVGATRNSLLGRSRLAELGLKGSYFKGRLFAGVAGYEQTRTSFDPLSTVGGAASSTISRGFEAELRWLITKQLSLTASGSWTRQKYLQGGVVSIDARSLGYPDVVDASGKIVIPSEAFAWGGRLATVIPDSEPRFRKVEGIPDHVINATASYNFDSGCFLGLTLYDQGSFSTDRLGTIVVPGEYTFDGTVGYRTKKWEAYFNITNLTNREIYNKGSFWWLDPKFQRAVDFTIVRHF